MPVVKKLAFFSASALLAAYAAFLVVTAVSPFRFESDGRWFGPPCDFSLRMSEIKCLKTGTDPFDVWHGDIRLKPFRPNFVGTADNLADEEYPREEGYVEFVNAYVPWEYTAMLPLSFLPRRVAWAMYFVFMLACLAVLFEIGRRHGARIAGACAGAIVGATAILAAWYPAWSNVCIGNFSVVVVAATALMAACLDRGRDVLAGVCWAVAMLKPQLGLAFAVPLLMQRKFLTCAVAAGICLLASFPAAAIGHVSALKMILEAPSANTAYFHGCGTMPYALAALIPMETAVLVGLVLGALCCFFMTRAIGRNHGWLVYLMPAAVCAMSWTYASSYGHFAGWFFFLVLFAELAKNPRSRFLRILLVPALLSVSRISLLVQRVAVAFGSQFATSETVGWNVDSFNSTLDLILAAALCWWIGRNQAESTGAENPSSARTRS